ncbi:hypothetical protein THRCLA_01481 [Thraustotheca clavata]|uniref:Man1/Src1-like C-terminal domain-containing protein n=1 Tax=Thraustotheca clavata TaxID=74557 RepID=A0A1W0A864_9STRA|nr:hypothetical protein THRCLA_01481 [Thraustotheca clavata]
MSSVHQARAAAMAAQAKRIEDTISKRNTPSSAKHKVPLKRKQTATPRKEDVSLKKPKISSKSVPEEELRVCSLCKKEDSNVRTKCVVCNNKLHRECTVPIAVGVGCAEFEQGLEYCSFRCYYSNKSARKQTINLSTPSKTPAKPVPPTNSTPLRSIRKSTDANTDFVTPSKQVSWQSPTENTSEPWKLKSKSKYVEGDEIKAVLFTHSGVKARRPREEVYSDDKSDIGTPALNRRLIPDTPEPETPVRRTNATSSTPTPLSPQLAQRIVPPSTGKKKRPQFLKVEEKKPVQSYTYPQWFVFLVLLGLAITSSLVLMRVYLDSLPMCDSDNTTEEHSSLPSLQCLRCPEHGYCFDGTLHSCKEPYMLVERDCIEPVKVRQDAALMADLLERYLVRQASSTFCNNSILSLLFYGTQKRQILIQNFDMRSYLHTQANWKSISPVVFDASFSKAVSQLSLMMTTRHFTREGHIALTIDDTNWMCWTILKVHDHIWIYSSVVFGTLGVLYLYKQIQKSKYRKRLFTKMLQAVHNELRRQDADEDSHPLDGSVARLREDILKTCFPGSSNSKEADRMWKSLAQHVQKDSRIRERHIMYRGQQVLIWEWLDHRRQKTPRAKREAPPVVAGQVISHTPQKN